MTEQQPGAAAATPKPGFVPQARTPTEADPPVRRLPGASREVEATYMDLLNHSKKLGRLGRWDASHAFTATGLALLGAGLGALLSGEKATGWVLLTCVVGAVLLISSLFIHRERAISAADLKDEFDAWLSLYEHEGMLAEMRDRYGDEPPPPRVGAMANLRRFFHV
jgi:hypothetical protein